MFPLLKKHSPSSKTHTTLSLLLAISDNTINATQYRHVRQYSTVSNWVKHSTETYIIFNMTVFCDEEETNTFPVLNEWSIRKSQK